MSCAAGPRPRLCFRIRIDQSRISDLGRGRLERISLERLIRWLAELHYRVDVSVAEDQGWINRRTAGAKTRVDPALRTK